jgi:hypothetical protein
VLDSKGIPVLEASKNNSVMLEIKDKEKSALRAVKAASHDPRFRKVIENRQPPKEGQALTGFPTNPTDY